MSGLRMPRFPPSEWISNYVDSVLDPETLRVEVDTFMEAYDKRIAEVGFPWGRWCPQCCVALDQLASGTRPNPCGVQAPLFPAESCVTWPGDI